MRLNPAFHCIVIMLCASTTVAVVQTAATPSRNPEAISIVNQAIAVAGGQSIVASLHDYKSEGKITCYWAGDTIQGGAIAWGRGNRQFRLDAMLPDGVRSMTVDEFGGAIRDQTGRTEQLLQHNTLHYGSLTVPIIALSAALDESKTSLSYLGIEAKDGVQAHHIRVQTTVENDHKQMREQLSRRDFFIDTTTLNVVATTDMFHPKYRTSDEYLHEMRFLDYREVNGLRVPFEVSEIDSGQIVFTIRLTSFEPNPGLSPVHFKMQP